MADGTHIEWTEATWNPVTGCSVTSPGCTNCYAMKLAGTRLAHHPSRAGLTRDSKAGPVWTGEVRFNEQWLDQPLRWRRPRMIFVCAHGDLFHEDVPDEWIIEVFGVAIAAHHLNGHVLQFLTKRAARQRSLLSSAEFWEQVDAWTSAHIMERVDPLDRRSDDARATCDDYGPDNPPPGIWLGVSVEDGPRAAERIPDLRATPAACRWLSCEPLLSGILFDPCDLAGIDWLVAGGESGSGARPMHPDWARNLRDQCADAGVPFFFKQWGEWAPVCEMSEEALDGCYHPAPETRPEARRRRRVDQCVLHRDGRRFDGSAMYRRPAFEQGSGAMTMMAVGKKRAGRLLDGVEHSAMPVP